MHASKIVSALQKYLPADSIDYVINLLTKYPCRFVISKPRKTKLGDYRMDADLRPRISVNGDLNQFAFLITTIHEFAHLIAFKQYGRKIQPHGSEWQGIYRDLLLPLIDKRIFPKDIENVLMKSLIKVKASSCSDLDLYRVLSGYDIKQDTDHTLESLDLNEEFELNGRVFQKGKLRRSRFVCMEKHTQKVYLVHALARVKKKKDE